MSACIQCGSLHRLRPVDRSPGFGYLLSHTSSDSPFCLSYATGNCEKANARGTRQPHDTYTPACWKFVVAKTISSLAQSLSSANASIWLLNAFDSTLS